MVLIFLQVSSVQTLIAKYSLEYLSEKSSHQISLDKVKISWLDNATLNDFLILDLKNDTMVYAESLSIDYKLLDMIKGNYLNFEEILSDNIRVRLVKKEKSDKLNISVFIQNLAKEEAEESSGRLIVEEIGISNLKLTLDDESQERNSEKMDLAHLDLDIPSIELSEFGIHHDTIEGALNHFSCRERYSGFAIEEFISGFKLSNQSLSLDRIQLKTPSSHISDSLEFFFNGLDDFGYFIDSVTFICHFENTRISARDISILTGNSTLKSDILLDGIFWGQVGDFNIEDARIGIGSQTFVNGGLSCFGLPDLQQTFVLADITNSHIEPNDLKPYVGSFSENLHRMGKIDFVGSFAGFLRDFVAKGSFITEQGSVHSDINIKIPNNPLYTSYDGLLELEKVNIGAFLENELIETVNLRTSIKGTGITRESADFNMSAALYNSTLNNYEYDSVLIDGHFERNFFSSSITINDPNCDVRGFAELDTRGETEHIYLDVKLGVINADTLNLTSQNISGSGHIETDVRNFSIDDLIGELRIDSGLIELDGKIVLLDSILISSRLNQDSTRIYDINLPGIKSKFEGDFTISSLASDIPILAEGYAKKLQLIDSISTGSGLFKSDMQASYKLNALIELNEIDPYLDSLKLPIQVSKDSKIDISIRRNKNSNISIFSKADSITLWGNRVDDVLFEANASTSDNLSSILTNFIFKSESQKIKGIPETNDLMLEGVWYDDLIEISTLLKQKSSSTDIRLESQLKLTQDSMVYSILPSDLLILDDQWQFNPSNHLSYKSGQLSINNFEIFDQSESIWIGGHISVEDSSSVLIAVEDLNMDKANLISDASIEGFLNGNFEFFRSSADENLRFEGGFFLKGLKYDKVLIGDLHGNSEWDPMDNSVYSKIEVVRNDFNSIKVDGYYFPSQVSNQLDFDVQFDKADLVIGRPFLEPNVSDLQGFATGGVTIQGNMNQPLLTGKFHIENGYGVINYLKTPYSFIGDVVLEDNQISLPKFNVVDRKGSNAVLSGGIMHSSFKDFRTNLLFEASNFEFLNTTSLDNDLYYGSAYGSGEIRITGPFDDLLIQADVKSEANTRVFIPVTESSSAAQEEFVRFVNISDTTSLHQIDDEIKIQGLTLDFDLEITPDAYCELIFDIKKGDIIRGRGRGNLKLLLNTDGEFSMFGPLEITDGAYNFTLSNLINKEFVVVPESRIVWYGDPYDASLALEATYLQRASFEALDENANAEESTNSNKVPVLAVLNMNGTMLAPEISFDIKLQDDGDATPDIITNLTRISNDEQELRRQFISLLFLKRFSPFESFALGTGEGLGGSVSEILSNQVSYLVSQIDENLEVEVDLASLDDQAFNTFQLRFAYTLLDGRLKVTRGGNFGSSDEEQNQNMLNNIIGDWSVEYSLTQDGRLRAKVFQNTNDRLTNFANGGFSQETGFSLRFVHSFNDLSELLTTRRLDAIRRKEEEEKTTEIDKI